MSSPRITPFFWLTFITQVIYSQIALGQPVDANTAAVLAVRTFITQATRQYGGAVNIQVGQPAVGTSLPVCSNHEVFLPAETRLWGKIQVGVKCSHPTAWTVYLPATVKVTGRYLVSAKKINRGQIITEGDFESVEGDLTEVSTRILTSPEMAIGRRAKTSLIAHQPLTRDHLIMPPVIRQGEKIKIIVHNSNFSVSTEGTALHNAADGESIKVRNDAGRTLIGTARLNGVVELAP